MISIMDIFKLVMRYAFEKKGRVILTIAGIIIGIFTFTFFIFLSDGLSNAITSQFTSFGVNVMGIQAVSNAGINGAPGGGTLTDTDIARVKQVVRGYKYIAPEIFYTGNYEYSRQKIPLTSLSFPPKYIDKINEDLGLEVIDGRFLKSTDLGVAIIGSKVVDKFGSNKKLKIGSVIKANGVNLRVIGILKSKGDLMIDNVIITSWSDIKKISGQNTYTVIRASFYDKIDINEMIAKVDTKFNRPNKPKKVEIRTPSQILDKFNSILGLLKLIIGFISAIALVVGGINVMNTMHSNVIERTNEISVMKALGAENFDIMKIFLIESSILGFIGAYVGFVLAFGLAKSISYVITNFAGYNVPVNFDLGFFLMVIIGTTLIATLFGTYPASRAAKINPSDNLRDD